MLDNLNNYFIQELIGTKLGMPRIVEVFLMLLSLWWGIILSLPVSTFLTSATYAPMVLLASEPIWAGYFLVITLIQCTGLVTEKKKIVSFGLMLATVTWLFVGTMMLLGSLATTGTGVYLLVALLSATTYFYKGIEKS